MSKTRKEGDSCKPAFACLVDVMQRWNSKAIVFSGPKKVLSINVSSKLLKHFTSVLAKHGSK